MTAHDFEYQLAGPASPPVPALVLHAFRTGFPDGMPRAACRGEDPELFSPIAVASPAWVQAWAAKDICGRCPVRADCLAYALVTGRTVSGAGPHGKNAGLGAARPCTARQTTTSPLTFSRRAVFHGMPVRAADG